MNEWAKTVQRVANEWTRNNYGLPSLRNPDFLDHVRAQYYRQ